MDIVKFMQTSIIVTSRSIEKLLGARHLNMDIEIVWLCDLVWITFLEELVPKSEKVDVMLAYLQTFYKNIPFLFSYTSSNHWLVGHFLKKNEL